MNENEMKLVFKYYDQKLQELMSHDDYKKWAYETALKVIKATFEEMAEGDFRDFSRENFTAITGARYDEVDLLW